MAGNDELIYRVKLEKDQQSFGEMKKSLKEMQEQAQKFGEGEASESTQEFTGALKELNEETSTNIDSLIELQKNIDAYKTTLKNLRKAKNDDVNISEIQRNTEAETRQALKATRKEYRDTEKAVIAATQAGEGQGKTYNELSAENRNLAAEMKNIPFDDTTGRLDELKEKWAENNEALKDFDAEMGDHRRNVGNYSEAMSTAASAVAAFQGPLGPIAGRINSINTTIRRSLPLMKAKIASWGALRVAMLATGIGAIVVALGTLLAALRTMQPVMDAITKRTQQLGAAWGFARDRIGALFGMNEKSNVSFTESIRLAGELADREAALEEKRIGMISTNAELQRSIAELRQEAEDESFSFDERIAKMEEAERQAREYISNEIEVAKEELAIAQERAAMARNEREDDENLAEAKAELSRLRQQEAMQIRQLTRRRQSIINQKRVEEERRRKNIESIRDEARALREASNERIENLRRESEAMLEEGRMDRMIDFHKRFGDERQAILLESEQRADEIEREFDKKREEAKEESEKFINARIKEIMLDGVTDRAEAERQAQQEADERLKKEREQIRESENKALTNAWEETQRELSLIEKNERDDRQNIREQITRMQEEEEMRRNALMQNIRSDAHRQMILLEVEFEQRRNELEEEFRKEGFDKEERAQLAHQQSMLEFEQQFQDAKTQIQLNEQQRRLEAIDHFTDISNNLMVTAFGDMKEVRIAQAIIDTLAGANRALSESPPGLRWLEFAAVMSAGMANVAQIRRTELGSNEGAMQSASSSQGGLSSSRGFEVVDDRQEGMVARQVAETSSDRNSDNDPTFIFQGDLDSEVMAIKVRKGNRTIDSKTLTTKSRA